MFNETFDVMNINKLIEQRVEKAREQYDLAKASVGRKQSLSGWIEKELKRFYKLGQKAAK